MLWLGKVSQKSGKAYGVLCSIDCDIKGIEILIE